jgi:serine/threonine-protein kinase HipA
MADAIRRFGDDVAAELRELWRRLMFSLLASNYDDHLRNHGFLMVAPGRWALSPAYDLNPVPEMERALTPKTPITEEGAETSVAVALAAAPRFGLRSGVAKADLAGLVAGTLAAYESAFEHPLMDEARRLSSA